MISWITLNFGESNYINRPYKSVIVNDISIQYEQWRTEDGLRNYDMKRRNEFVNREYL